MNEKKSLDEIMKEIQDNIIALREEINGANRSYKSSVGWTTKYRNALSEANRKLIEVGLEPVKVIGENKEISKNEQRILDEAQQESFF